MLKHKEILPLVLVTKNPFFNLEKILNFFVNTKDHNFSYLSKWHEYTNSHGITGFRTEFKNGIYLDCKTLEGQVLDEIRQIRKLVLNDYIEKYINNEIWDNSISFLKEETRQWYNNGFDIFMHKGSNFDLNHAPYVLDYHTDARVNSDGLEQHIITNMFYLNDNYDCGEIEFFYNDSTTNKYKVLSYKPSAGDVITFPSFYPYFHAVRAPYNGNRYAIRTSYNDYYEKIVKPNKIQFDEFFGYYPDIRDGIGYENYITLNGKDLFMEEDVNAK